MNNLRIEISNIKCDMGVLSEHIDDWLNVQRWLMESYFVKQPRTTEDVTNFALSFNEMRIKISQQEMMIDYFNMTLKKLIERIGNIELEQKKTASISQKEAEYIKKRKKLS